MRTVFLPKETKPYYRKLPVEFDFFPGLSPVQKMKNVQALTDAFHERYPHSMLLEVSTKSGEEKGRALSPFNLKLTLKSLKKAFPLECVYQSSKVVESGGPYYDLLGASPLDAKRDERTHGKAVSFVLEGDTYPGSPDFLFYNWLYLNAVIENHQEKTLLEQDAFSDIEFAAEDGNCQARACAIAKSLLQLGLVKRQITFEQFVHLMMEEPPKINDEHKKNPVRPADVKKERTIFYPGDWLEHPSIGQGQVIKRTPRDYTIMFRVSGPKTLRKESVEEKCRKL